MDPRVCVGTRRRVYHVKSYFILRIKQNLIRNVCVFCFIVVSEYVDFADFLIFPCSCQHGTTPNHCIRVFRPYSTATECFKTIAKQYRNRTNSSIPDVKNYRLIFRAGHEPPWKYFQSNGKTNNIHTSYTSIK